MKEEVELKIFLDTLYFVATSYARMKIDMGRFLVLKDLNKFTLIFTTLRSVCKSLKNKKVKFEALELYDITAIVLEDTSYET